MMLDKNQIQAIFLFEFKATETTRSIHTFGQEPLTNVQHSGAPSSAKATRAEGTVAGHRKLTATN